MKRYIIMAALSAWMLNACTHKHEQHAHEQHAHEEHAHTEHAHEEHAHEGHAHAHEGHADEIALTDSKAHAAGVEVEVVKPTNFQQVIKCSGEILAAQGNETTLVANVAGVVSLQGKVYEGMRIGQGAALMSISAKHIAEGDPAEKARIAYNVAKEEYERMEALVADKIVSAKAFAQAKERYENARIAYEAVSRNQAASGTSVKATLGGYVKNLLVKEGDYVSVGQPLVSITQNQRLSLRADVAQRHYQALGSIASANFCTPYNNKVYQLAQLNGRLLSYGRSSEGGGNMVPVNFEFDNRGEVIPGSFVEVYLLGATQEGVIALPRTALTEEQGSYFVYKQVHPERYAKQLVKVGASDGERVQILQGVHAGEKVVVRGAYQVKLASASHAIPGHSHEH